MPNKNNAPARVATCHPEARHLARGLCKACYDKDYGERNRARTNAKARTWAASNKDRIKAIKRKSLYGIDDARFQAMFAEQGGVCAICRDGAAEHVDHDHATHAVRGLLCGHCNRGIGLFRDEPARLLSAAEYLRRAVRVEANTGVRLG